MWNKSPESIRFENRIRDYSNPYCTHMVHLLVGHQFSESNRFVQDDDGGRLVTHDITLVLINVTVLVRVEGHCAIARVAHAVAESTA